ncbi:hypothetical protein [uncultured Winogradskyella sp.]|uniref:hypothetical protein n=1 Tax=uncultured Winogradskyella sp. TaxID=395353 RepID=UPI00260765A3|nr:hypothetical protein [uncultured Winogradskyella sp.]
MKSIEQLKWEEELMNNRLKDQQQKKDYNEEKEKCLDCGSYLNSHDHCPRCDY